MRSIGWRNVVTVITLGFIMKPGSSTKPSVGIQQTRGGRGRRKHVKGSMKRIQRSYAHARSRANAELVSLTRFKQPKAVLPACALEIAPDRRARRLAAVV